MLTMATDASSTKRPRLSLQIKSGAGTGRTSRALALADPKSPTAFNTLSNVYVTAIERSTTTPCLPEPLTAINTLQLAQVQPSIEKEQTKQLHTPYAVYYPETPLTAHPASPMTMEMTFPSAIMTATPPLSAGPTEPNAPSMFSFTPLDPRSLSLNTAISPVETRAPRRRVTHPASGQLAGLLPYNHPRSLHSILRNSPLPPPSAMTPMSPRRQSARLMEKAARRVAYNNPLEQTIINSRYTKSHIDLLCEEASPCSPSVNSDQDTVLDLALAFTGNETRDGGQTPGPFEEMRRRMASLGTTTPVSPGGVRKRKKKDKKRRWVWTIGQEEETVAGEEVSGAMAAIKAAEAAAIAAKASKPAPTQVSAAQPPFIRLPQPRNRQPQPQEYADLPTPSVETFDASYDVEMSDTSSMVSEDRGLTPGDMELDMQTPVAPRKYERQSSVSARSDRLSSVDLLASDANNRRDTPVPPDMLMA